MKIHNYGNDYVMSMKFQKEKENVADTTQRTVEESGKGSDKAEAEKEEGTAKATKETVSKKQERKERASNAADKKEK